MPKPLAICLEDLDAPSDATRYLQCTARVGRDAGLRLDHQGRVFWRSEAGACELWVSLDDRLILYRTVEAGTVTVRRLGRSLDAPPGKPVVLIDQDEVDVGTRRLRIHVHGPAPAETAPSFFRIPSVRAGAAAALALGAALGGAACKKEAAETRPDGNDVEVRSAPPAVALTPDAAAPEPRSPTGLAADVGQDIEVRVSPPAAPIYIGPDVAEPPPVAPDAGPDAGAAATSDAAAEPPADAAPDEAAVEDARRQRDQPIEVRVHPPAVRRTNEEQLDLLTDLPDPEKSR